MARHKNPPRNTSPVRREVASVAARIMAEDGIDDYGHAKRKAARSLGLGENEVLPTNGEVEAELRTYQSLYQEEEQRERLQELRRAALEVMQMLDDFRPYLTGAVLDGTAGRYAEVELDLFADSAKDVEIALLDRRINYRASEPKRRGAKSAETLLRFDHQGAPILLNVYPLALERHQRRNPHSNARNQRARAAAVASLIEHPNDVAA